MHQGWSPLLQPPVMWEVLGTYLDVRLAALHLPIANITKPETSSHAGQREELSTTSHAGLKKGLEVVPLPH